MNVLVACEESQRVTSELRAKGINAFSCDLLEPSGKRLEWHVLGDCLPLLNGNCTFTTMDGVDHTISTKWDAIIAFPPCTHLAVSGARHFAKKRQDGRQLQGIQLFASILNADCERIAVENPVNIIGGEYIREWFPDYTYLPKPTQRIQPFYFGDKSKKTTCLWLKGFPELEPTNIVEPDLIQYTCQDGRTVTFSRDYCQGGGDNARRRSKTYPGVAKAIAEQWFKEV